MSLNLSAGERLLAIEGVSDVSPGIQAWTPQNPSFPLPVWTKIRGAVKGFLIGTGITMNCFIAIAVIAANLKEDSGSYTMMNVLFLLSAYIPIVMAVRSWYTTRRNTPTL